MSDEISIAEKQYISSKRASELSGYTQDYIGQLARGGYIEAERVGGLWYVRMESLLAYKEKADTYKPQPPLRVTADRSDPESLISFDGKDYISAQRAAKVTRYNQDYIGQLAREGKILSRRVGSRWYVDRDAILSHKETKDALLAAVQAESVGIVRPGASERPQEARRDLSATDTNLEALRYIPDHRDLLPLRGEWALDEVEVPNRHELGVKEPVHVTDLRHSSRTLPIRKVAYSAKKNSIPGKTRFVATVGAVALTVVVVFSVGFWSFRNTSVFTVVESSPLAEWGRGLVAASSGGAIDRLLDVLERYLAPELIYRRGVSR